MLGTVVMVLTVILSLMAGLAFRRINKQPLTKEKR